jgi:membrane-associated phospholipid phosphatase
MDLLSSFGISFVTAFQSLGSWLVAPMEFFSFLGSENFFLIFMPLIYWSVDARLGIRVGFIMLAGNGLNALFKLPMQAPRPYWVSSNVGGLASETGFGIPSGHAETAAGMWGMIAAYYRKAWLWVAALFLVFAIGLSRLYLGVHFPHDVVVGWALGFLTLWAVVSLWRPVEARVKKMSSWNQIGLAFAVSLAMILLGALLVFLARDFVIPAEWVVNATRDGNAAPDPFTASMQPLITAAAALFGLWSGLAWMARRGRFDAAGPLWKRLVRYLVGLLIVIILYAGTKAIFPSGDTLVPASFRFVRYALVGFWVSGGAPWTFARLHLTEGR